MMTVKLKANFKLLSNKDVLIWLFPNMPWFPIFRR
jgi:hypothetical protein